MPPKPTDEPNNDPPVDPKNDPPADPKPNPKPDPKPEPKPEDKSYTQAEMDAAVKKAQKEAEKKAADAEAKAKLSEDERTKAEIEDLKNEIRDRDARDAITSEAAKRELKNANVFYKLLKGDIEFDANGKVSNIDDLFESAKADYPELFEKAAPEGIDGGKKGGETSFEDEISEAFKKTGRTNSYRL